MCAESVCKGAAASVVFPSAVVEIFGAKKSVGTGGRTLGGFALRLGMVTCAVFCCYY